MKLKSLRAFQMNLPLTSPFVTAHRRVEFAKDVLIELVDSDGNVGRGSAPPTTPLTGETTRGILAVVEEVITPFLQQQSNSIQHLFSISNEQPRKALQILSELSSSLHLRLPHNAGARGALETAVLDLVSQKAHKPIWEYLLNACEEANETTSRIEDSSFLSTTKLNEVPLGTQKTKLTTDATVSIASPEDMAFQTKRLREQGFSHFKIKLEGNSEADYQRLVAIKNCLNLAEIHPSQQPIKSELRVPLVAPWYLRLDANEAYTYQNAYSFLERAQKLLGKSLTLIEQPLHRRNLKELAKLADNILCPVFLDESLMDDKDFAAFYETKALRGAVLKLSKSAGPLNLWKSVQRCLEQNKQVMVSCMLESPISLTAAAHVAQAASLFCRKNSEPSSLLFDLDAVALISQHPFVTPWDPNTPFELPELNCPGLGCSLKHDSTQFLDLVFESNI
jgi:L-Ala-D/L-Glu epimerase